jgi:hypothetical protein
VVTHNIEKCRNGLVALGRNDSHSLQLQITYYLCGNPILCDVNLSFETCVCVYSVLTMGVPSCEAFIFG